MVEIIESTPRRLVLRKSGRTIQLLLLAGVAMLLIDCVILCFTARTTSLRCARGPAGLTCDVTEKLLGIIPLHSRRIEQVERAVVDSAGDASEPTYRVALRTADGHETPLSSTTATETQCAFFVGRFNDFVRSGQGADDFLELPDLLTMVMLPVLFLIPLACFAMAQPYRLEIDRDLEYVIIRDGITRKTFHQLADVDDVRVEERVHEGKAIREVFMLLKAGKRVRLAIEPAQVDLVGDYLERHC